MDNAEPAPPVPSNRIDALDPPWPARPVLMAALCAVAGVIFYNLVETSGAEAPAAFVAVAAISFVMTVERRRLGWAAGFALLWGAVIALIVQNNRGYNVNASPFEWPFWSGLLAIVVAAPLFQSWRDFAVDARGWRWDRLPYDRLHLHAWTDAVIGAAAGAFVGISLGLAFLIAGLFDLIGIDVLRKLLEEGWFVLALFGMAFGGAVGLLRERDRLVGTLQRLVMVVLAVLAPVLAAALVLFLAALLATGLAKLWASGFSTAAMMLGAAAFAVLLANAVIGSGSEERASNPLLRWAAPVLVVGVLPLSVIALWAMLLRIGQYGWTPERLWGMVAVLVALAYGLAGLWAVVRGRRDFDDVLRPVQQKLAIGLMLLAAILALPILDFGAISTRDQLARLESGQVKPENFDWAALAFDFGPDGRAALAALAKSNDKSVSEPAKVAMATKNRWDLTDPSTRDGQPLRPIEKMVRVLPADRPLPAAALDRLRSDSPCRMQPCIAQWLDDRTLVIVSRYRPDSELEAQLLVAEPATQGSELRWELRSAGTEPPRPTRDDGDVDLARAAITLERVDRYQITVDGRPVGPAVQWPAPSAPRP